MRGRKCGEMQSGGGADGSGSAVKCSRAAVQTAAVHGAQAAETAAARARGRAQRSTDRVKTEKVFLRNKNYMHKLKNSVLKA